MLLRIYFIPTIYNELLDKYAQIQNQSQKSQDH